MRGWKRGIPIEKDGEMGITTEILEHIEVARELVRLAPAIEKGGALAVATLKRGGKILLAGNGGSAGDAQHIAAELVGRFKRERPGLPAIALTTDSSILTAVANDYSFEEVFTRQLEALGRKGDLFIPISTSGNSKNVVKATNRAKELGLKVITLTGNGGGELGKLGDINIIVPSSNTPRIQEMHILIGHLIAGIVDRQI
ncbi:MAG: D-sedoheptulose 7-phosphate isomerase [Campylobacterales bacterium]